MWQGSNWSQTMLTNGKHKVCEFHQVWRMEKWNGMVWTRLTVQPESHAFWHAFWSAQNEVKSFEKNWLFFFCFFQTTRAMLRNTFGRVWSAPRTLSTPFGHGFIKKRRIFTYFQLFTPMRKCEAARKKFNGTPKRCPNVVQTPQNRFHVQNLHTRDTMSSEPRSKITPVELPHRRGFRPNQAPQKSATWETGLRKKQNI